MAELDYAYLADYAAVQDGKLSAIGASFTHVVAVAIPTSMSIGIAGRIRTTSSERTAALTVRITAPDDGFDIELSGVVAAADAVRPYADGKLGLLFALNAQVPIMSEGLYTFDIEVNGKNSRRLAFSVETHPVS